jgi:diphthamide synthase (EF-2-diphthine--ammonia ligase)
MNTKIDFGTNQSLISKPEILLQDAKSWIEQLIELAPIVCLSPLWEWKSKESKLNLLHKTHKKVSPEMSIP